jgi:hypothetical protein
MQDSLRGGIVRAIATTAILGIANALKEKAKTRVLIYPACVAWEMVSKSFSHMQHQLGVPENMHMFGMALGAAVVGETLETLLKLSVDSSLPRAKRSEKALLHFSFIALALSGVQQRLVTQTHAPTAESYISREYRNNEDNKIFFRNRILTIVPK